MRRKAISGGEGVLGKILLEMIFPTFDKEAIAKGLRVEFDILIFSLSSSHCVTPPHPPINLLFALLAEPYGRLPCNFHQTSQRHLRFPMIPRLYAHSLLLSRDIRKLELFELPDPTSSSKILFEQTKWLEGSADLPAMLGRTF